MIYDDRAKYRSQVMVYVGEPIQVVGSVDGDQDRDAVVALTEQIHEHLEAVAPSWENWRQHDDARIAARLTVAARPELDYAEVVTGLNQAVDDQLPEALEMCAVVEQFEDEVDRIGIDLDVVVDEPVTRLEEVNRRSLLESFIWWPVVWIGRLLNLVPFLTIRAAANKQSLDIRATFKIIVGVFVYPIWWIVIGLVVGWLVHPAAGLAVALCAPLLGYLSARIHRRLRHVANRLSVESFREIDPEASSALVAGRTAVVKVTESILAGSS